MQLYQATYKYSDVGTGKPNELTFHIIASDFQAALKLAQDDAKLGMGPEFKGLANKLEKIELIAYNVIQG